jgi:hypothetical protein
MVLHFTALGNGSNENSLVVASWKDRHGHFSQLLSAAVAAAVTLQQQQEERASSSMAWNWYRNQLHSPNQKCQSFSQFSKANLSSKLLPQLMSIFFFLNSNAQMPIFRWEI